MLNKAQIIGYLGKDPEVRYLQDGTAVANFPVATSESWKDKKTGEKKEATEWHRVNMFDKLAEIAGQYLKKGSLVYIEGKLKTRKWQDKDGRDRYTTEIQAHGMKMLGGKDLDAGAGHASEQQPDSPRHVHVAPPQQSGTPTAPAGNGGFLDGFDDDVPW